MYRLTALAVVACASLATPSDAAVYVMSGSGKVDSIMALQNSERTTPPAGSINIGDDFSFSFRFDTTGARPSEPFVTDPTVNIYDIRVTDFNVRIGSYSYVFTSSSTLQLWNDHEVVGRTDAQSFSFYGRGPNQLPFNTGIGETLESLSIYAFDRTSTARNSDSIDEIAPAASFSSRPFSWLQYNLDARLSVHVGGSYNATIAAVPEPATWAMMIGGFGLVGGAMRRRRSVTAIAA